MSTYGSQMQKLCVPTQILSTQYPLSLYPLKLMPPGVLGNSILQALGGCLWGPFGDTV